MKRGSTWLAFGVLWAAYTLVYTGYVWVRGYDIGFLSLISPVQFYQQSDLKSAGTVGDTDYFPKARAGG